MDRNIKTAYWARGKCVQINSGKDLDRAVGQAIIHMRRNTYKADYVEVFDAADANLLHAQVKRSRATGKTTIYERAKTRGDRVEANRYAATPLLNDDWR